MANANCVCIQLGQCGTQLGHEFLNGVYEDCVIYNDKWKKGSKNQDYRYVDDSMSTFFTENFDGTYNARSVMVDMEPKAVTWAIQSTKAKNNQWKYPKHQQLCRNSGSGNNWSCGYHIHGPKCCDEVLELVRKEVERCDRFGGFFIVMSLAGGTGSGVGSKILEVLRDNYQHSPVLNSVVLPYSAGEVAVQNYNAILTLSSVISNADGLILLHNDNLHEVCKKIMAINKVSFKDLNKVAAHDLGTLFQSSSCNHLKSRNIIHDLLRSTSCHSIYKLLNLKTVPHIAEGSLEYSSFNWIGLLKRIRQMHITNSSIDEGMNWHLETENRRFTNFPKSLANLLVVRGENYFDIKDTELKILHDKKFYVPWIPPKNRCLVWKCSRPYMSYEKSITLLSNGSCCIQGLNGIVHKGWDMFSAKAYVHQYTKYGLDEEDFLNAFIKIENVLKSYEML